MLLPGDIASPAPHPLLGDPLTFVLGDATPPFQAYVVPAHEHGWIGRLFDQVDAMEADDDLRPAPLGSGTAADPASTRSDPTARERVDATMLEFAGTLIDHPCLPWLCHFIQENATEPEAALHLLDLIRQDVRWLDDVREAHRLAGISCPRAVVALAQYRRLKHAHLAKQRGCAESAAPSQGDGPAAPSLPLKGRRNAPPAPSTSPEIVIKADNAALHSFSENLPFPASPSLKRSKRTRRKRA